MALGMMPCSSSDVAVSKPVPIVYVFPAPVCISKGGMRVLAPSGGHRQARGPLARRTSLTTYPGHRPLLVPKPHPEGVSSE